MKISMFRKILKEKIDKTALEYLTSKQGEKGGEIKYSEIIMSEYLQPNESGLSISQKQEMFSIINRMVNISGNFPVKSKVENCICQEEAENMQHVYSCKLLNNKSEEFSYNYLFNGNIQQQIKVYKRFKNNLEEREKLKTDLRKNDLDHTIPDGEPLYSV